MRLIILTRVVAMIMLVDNDYGEDDYGDSIVEYHQCLLPTKLPTCTNIVDASDNSKKHKDKCLYTVVLRGNFTSYCY